MRLKDFPSNTAVIICQHLYEKTRPVRLVMRDHENDIVMMCGEEGHDFEKNLPRVVGLGHLLERDERIGSLSPKMGFEANLTDDGWAIQAILKPEDQI